MDKPKKDRLVYFGRPAIKSTRTGQKYSFFVRIMRLVLPLLAVGIIGLLWAWPQVEEMIVPLSEDDMVLPKVVSKNELINPRFESTDDKSQPFAITASRASQSAGDPAVVLLEKPMADITLTNGTRLEAQADSGAYRQEAERLMLQGHVKLLHDQGYEMSTEKLLLNLKNKEAWSDQPVSGFGPAGTLQASGVQAYAGTEQLIFTGPVKLVLNKAIRGIE